MKPRPTQVWYPGKVLPWSSLTIEQFGREVPSKGPDGCYGFIPMYETEEAARAAFPGDVILSFRLMPPDATPPDTMPKPKKRKARKGAK